MGMTWMCYVAAAALTAAVLAEFPPSVWGEKGMALLFSVRCPTGLSTMALVGYVVALAAMGSVMPGRIHRGVPLKDGSRLKYKCNGLPLGIVLLVSLFCIQYYGYIKGSFIVDHYAEFLSTAFLTCVGLTLLLYMSAWWTGRGTFTTNFLRDLWLGVELNPHLFGVNMKFFWLRPSMMGWALINLSFLAKHYELHGHVSVPMVLFQLFQILYILDYFYFEEYMTSTWDIIAENFGFMLIWGDMVWIPFVFSIPAWYLYDNAFGMSPAAILCTCATWLLGYTIFRGSNKQKHDFKRNPKVLIWGKPAQAINGKLLVSGWWGLSRHMNYVGDIIMGIAWSLPCITVGSIVPFIYPIYLTLLLVHRQIRDEIRCAAKYGALWEEYCNQVPFRLIPFVY